MLLTFRYAQTADLPAITDLLHKVFRPTYGHILPEPQIVFMLSTIFSGQRLAQQFREEGHRLLLMEDGEQMLGFAAFEPDAGGDPDSCKLHKLYLADGLQGRGLGRHLLEEVIREAKTKGQRRLVLNVNRANRAKHFYDTAGFRLLKEVDIPIGPGYYMNDYVLVRDL